MSTLYEKVQQKLIAAKMNHRFIDLPADLSPDIKVHVYFHGTDLSHAVPTLIFSTEKGLVAVQKRGDTEINNKKLRDFLDVKRLSFASSDVLERLGAIPGHVPLTGLEIPFFVDQHVLEVDIIYGGGGDTLHALSLSTADLVKLNNAKVGQFADIKKEHEDQLQNKTHQRILSGITPSGNSLHIGNYFGAVKPQIELQNTITETYYFVADLHALTTVQTREVLEKNIEGVVLDYLALGLDPEKCVFFRQSDVPQHSQLAIVLANYVTYGHMQRMHAFKDKLQKGFDQESINMGLFNYPILMAADILLYKPSGVPVGEDQRQHIEITRDMAEAFNKAYHQDIFPLPEPLIQQATGKIIGTDGERKMSKSLGNIIGIFEDEAVIRKQIMSSYTDPNRKKATNPGKVEGNPIFIYHDLINNDQAEVAELKSRYSQGKVGDVEVKEKLIAAHQRFFADARRRRAELAQHPDHVKTILATGANKAQQFAQKTLDEVYEVIGIKNKLND